MMTAQKVQKIIQDALPGAFVEVHSEDNVHFDAVVKAAQFKGLSRVAQQQKIYAALGDLITSGAVHALSLQTGILE